MLICKFCQNPIHFYESLVCVKGEFFHSQNITLNSLRCNVRHSTLMEKAEKEAKK